MNTVDFPSCCGIRICKNFGNTLTATHTTPHTPEEIDNYLAEETHFNYHQLIVAINGDQNKIMAPILKKHKFKLVSKFLYAGHNNMIYTYIRIPQKD